MFAVAKASILGVIAAAALVSYRIGKRDGKLEVSEELVDRVDFLKGELTRKNEVIGVLEDDVQAAIDETQGLKSRLAHAQAVASQAVSKLSAKVRASLLKAQPPVVQPVAAQAATATAKADASQPDDLAARVERARNELMAQGN